MPADPGVKSERTPATAPASLPAQCTPQTPAARMLGEWLCAVNTGEPGMIQKFLEEHFAPAALSERAASARAASFNRHYLQSRGWDIGKVIEKGPGALEALLVARLVEDWWRVRLEVEEVEDEAPHAIRRLDISAVPAPEEARAQGPMPLSEAAARLERYAGRLAEADVFSGAVLLAEGETIAFQRAYGLASRGYGVPNRLDTRFNLGSVNKMVTAACVLQQVERGRVDVRMRVGDVLPDYPNREVAEKVTIHHLLTHTSGLGSFFNNRFAGASRARFRKVNDYDLLYVDDPLQFAPGTRFSYSNSGFMLLGKILEAATGEDYFEYVRENIYRPAGMAVSDSYDLDADMPDIAMGYTNTGEDGRFQPGPRRLNIFTHISKGSPAGGGYSTVGDLLKFSLALRNGTLLSPEMRDLMTTPQVTSDFDPAVKHGYGIFLEEVDGRRIAGHTGVFAGVNSQVDMYLASGRTVVVLSNYDPPAAHRVAKKAREWVAR